MMAKNPLDEIADELVVFKHEKQDHPERYFSNDPRWNDSRIREAWMNKYSEEALTDSGANDEEVEDIEGDNYEEWTNDDLRAELANRKLSLDGKKVDLVNRLREDDSKEG